MHENEKKEDDAYVCGEYVTGEVCTKRVKKRKSAEKQQGCIRCSSVWVLQCFGVKMSMICRM
jgi:hypothetical protein